MEQQLQQIRDQQKESWNKFSQGWGKWDRLMMDFLEPMGDAIIQKLKLKIADHILDVASGTGEPGLTIAKIVSQGRVVISDLADHMLDIAREHAKMKGINNIEAVVCDVSELPFLNDSFDAISCRFGHMFFPDMLLATKEMVRVLKPGGRVAVSVWNIPEKNFWVTAIGGTISRNMQLPPPPPGAPGMFRCADAPMMEDLFRQAGLKHVTSVEVTGKLKAGTADTYWNLMTEVAAPFVSALSKADDAMRTRIRNEVFDRVRQKYPDGKVNIDCSALVIYGEK